jgi:hypothetical protein
LKCYICDKQINARDASDSGLSARKHWIYCAECDKKLDAMDQDHLKKLRFLAILLIFPYLSALYYYGDKVRKPVELLNSAGEVEYDRTSKRFNLIEGIGMYALVMFAMWYIIGYLGLTIDNEYSTFFEYLGYAIFGLGGIWALFLSPFFHRDSFHGLGFSKFFEIFELYKKSDAQARRTLKNVFIILSILVILLTIPNFDYTLHRWGMGDGAIHELLLQEIGGQHVPTTAGLFAAIALGIIMMGLLAIFMIRWDNFIPVLKKIIWVGFIAWGVIILTGVIYAIVDSDWSLFQNFTWISWDSQNSFIPHIMFYAIWGMLQQWLFLGYFNTRFRKGFKNTKIGHALCIISTGLGFCLIHVPALPLMTVTFIGGCFFGYYFQRDQYRNVFIMGICHGIGATLIGQLTPMIMFVGPWSI